MKRLILLLTLICLTTLNLKAQCFATANFSQTTNGLTVNFTNTSTCNSCVTTNYLWQFGDGNSSTLTNPTHTYAISGTYTVTLAVLAIDSFNVACYDTISIPITVSGTSGPQPCTAQLSHFVAGNTANFVTNVTGPPSTYLYAYNFGDGSLIQVGYSPVANHTYANTGTYFPCVTVTDTTNNTNVCTACDSVNIATSTLCSTTINTTVNNNTIVATASATGGAQPYTFVYTLTPGNISNGTGIFPGLNSGIYTVCATAYDTLQNICSQDCDLVTINNTSPCMANLSSTVNGANVNFNTTINSPPSTYIYSYNFGDGSPIVNSSSPNVSHTYLNPGTYYPCVTATDTIFSWNSCTACDTVVIAPTPCGLIVGFNQNTTGLTTLLTNTTQCNSCVSVSYLWNFGDGNSSSAFSPTHTYANAGNYVVTLTVTAVDSNNNTCIDSVTAVVNAQAATPCQIYLTTSAIQLTTTFTPVVTNAVPPLTFFFDYGDGTTGTSNIHTYPTAGAYYPCITVTDANNDTCTFCDTILVSTAFCNTYLSTSVNGSNISAVASAAWGTAPYTYSYTLMPGNITNTTGQFPGLNSGIYTVCATATDANNVICSSDCDSVVILINNPCIAQLNNTVNGNTANFTTTISGSPSTYIYSYNFGDGSPIVNSSSPNVSHTYLNPGTYYPCVTATDTVFSWNSCTACDTVVIAGTNPCSTLLNATVSGTTITAVATATGSTGPYTYTYTLNPGNVTNNTGVFTGLNNGIYLICATAFDTLLQTVCSQDCDTATISNSTSCTTTLSAFASGSTITSVASTTGGLAPYNYTYVLTPGNLSNNTGVFSSTPNGTYVVCVYSIDANFDSCAIACDSVLVGNIGGCSISAAFTETINGLNVNFANNTGISGGVITNYGWSFGDGNTSGNASPNHTYLSAGTYQVILGVTGLDTFQNLCVDTVSKWITVGPTSVNNVQQNSLTIYPNPTTNNFVIDLPVSEKLLKVEITDVSGRKITTNYTNMSNQKLSVSLESKASGIYFIKLQTNKNFYTSSIMKQE